ncbi:MAG: GDSL-type esterase/lipase family protein, partial [Actinomycetales bacterium]
MGSITIGRTAVSAASGRPLTGHPGARRRAPVLRRTGTVAGAALAAVAGFGFLTAVEVLWAMRRLTPPSPIDPVLTAGLFGDANAGEPLDLVLLGDSLAAGFGADSPAGSVGYMLADGLAELSGRPVRLHNVAVIGATSQDLPLQVAAIDERGLHPTVSVIIVGGNDVMQLRGIKEALASLAETVRDLRRRGSQVVLASCPDMGTVAPFLQPLRFFMHWV